MSRKYGCIYGLFLRNGWHRFWEDSQVKGVGAGLLVSGAVHVDWASLFDMAVVMDLMTKWIALAHGYLESQRERDSDFLSCLAAIPDMRWDLLYLPDYENDGVLVSDGKLRIGKAEFYRKQMISRNILT